MRRWHRDSIFGPGPRRPLDREQRARFRFLLRAHARAGRLPAKQEWVGTALLKRLSAEGRCDPSYDTLAADAGCSARTARRATATIRDLGLLRWQTRLVRTDWRCEQTSNAYELVPTAAAPHAARCGGHSGRETRKIDISRCQPADRETASAALAQRRAVIEARMLTNNNGGRLLAS
jgi:hypothetical protein